VSLGLCNTALLYWSAAPCVCVCVCMVVYHCLVVLLCCSLCVYVCVCVWLCNTALLYSSAAPCVYVCVCVSGCVTLPCCTPLLLPVCEREQEIVRARVFVYVCVAM